VFIGHFAVAFAAKRAAPEVSLGTLFLATQLADLVWPTLVLLGIESFSIRPGITAVTPLDFTRYPYSHSVVGMAAWGYGIRAWRRWRSRAPSSRPAPGITRASRVPWIAPGAGPSLPSLFF